jgi:hypothetical protein
MDVPCWTLTQKISKPQDKRQEVWKLGIANRYHTSFRANILSPTINIVTATTAYPTIKKWAKADLFGDAITLKPQNEAWTWLGLGGYVTAGVHWREENNRVGARGLDNCNNRTIGAGDGELVYTSKQLHVSARRTFLERWRKGPGLITGTGKAL